MRCSRPYNTPRGYPHFPQKSFLWSHLPRGGTIASWTYHRDRVALMS